MFLHKDTHCLAWQHAGKEISEVGLKPCRAAVHCTGKLFPCDCAASAAAAMQAHVQALPSAQARCDVVVHNNPLAGEPAYSTLQPNNAGSAYVVLDTPMSEAQLDPGHEAMQEAPRPRVTIGGDEVRCHIHL